MSLVNLSKIDKISNMARTKKIDQETEEPKSRQLSYNEKALLEAFSNMLRNATDVDSVLYILSLINKTVNGNRTIQLGDGTELNGDIIEGF